MGSEKAFQKQMVKQIKQGPFLWRAKAVDPRPFWWILATEEDGADLARDLRYRFPS